MKSTSMTTSYIYFLDEMVLRDQLFQCDDDILFAMMVIILTHHRKSSFFFSTFYTRKEDEGSVVFSLKSWLFIRSEQSGLFFMKLDTMRLLQLIIFNNLIRQF